MRVRKRKEPDKARCGVKIGSTVRFVSSANVGCSAGFPEIMQAEVSGTVILINEKHRWYRVEYCMGKPGCIGHECFKY